MVNTGILFFSPFVEFRSAHQATDPDSSLIPGEEGGMVPGHKVRNMMQDILHENEQNGILIQIPGESGSHSDSI